MGKDGIDLWLEGIQVTFSTNFSEAYLYLPKPIQEVNFSEADLRRILSNNKVVLGILDDTLSKIVSDKLYDQNILIAKGLAPVHGKDGSYEFLFDVEEHSSRPKVLSDGSVDYGSIGNVKAVEAGSVIVKYHPPTKGCNGFDIKGKVLTARRGKELPVLKGKGFTLTEDRLHYIAKVTGKAEFKNDRLNVSDLFQWNEDVSYVTGDIEFAGDILIKGNVLTGTMIRASGSITVNGHVEAATLIAGKDIILKNGMQGGGKGIINSEGNVSGKFFEQVNIYAKKSVNANAIMSCNIEAEQVVVSGKHGIIVGGVTKAIKSITATIVGNISEIKTGLLVGAEPNLGLKIAKQNQLEETLNVEISSIESGITTITNLLEKKENANLLAKKMLLLRAKISKNTQLNEARLELKRLTEQYEKSIGCKIVIRKSAYPGTKISIDGCIIILREEQYNVTFKRQGDDIYPIPNTVS